jgi:mono/diheme cytochrome c family protein
MVVAIGLISLRMAPTVRPRFRRRGRFVGLPLAAAAAAGVIVYAIIRQPEIPPIAPPAPTSFATTEIARGAELAAVGDCAVCHTMQTGHTTQSGRPFAGGRAVPTPFGRTYATNITPDVATGIGGWSLAAFRRAMRDGVDRAGRHLYPVLPYPHFTRATDADIAAMYAFLMTRAPVRQATPPNALPFPFNVRALLAGWNLLFLRQGEFQPDPTKDAAWNRGAYLVEAIGHYGACHTPHNLLGAEKNRQALAGGEAEGWDAPALQVGSPAPLAWNVDALATYLHTGFQAGHGAAAGPMAPVTQQLASAPDADIHAIAVYITSRMPPAPAAPTPVARTPATGAAKPAPPMTADAQRADAQGADAPAASMFNGACGACHAADAPMTHGGAPALALSSAVNAPTARNVVDMILHGLPWREGHAGPYMPAFADALTDAQVAVLAAYVRARYSDLPPWPDIEASVRQARREGGGT